MAEHHHHYKLKLPNGTEIDFGGDKEFVTQVYRDAKAAAVTLFNRESARTSGEEALDRMLGGGNQLLQNTAPAAPQLPPAAPTPAADAHSQGQPAGQNDDVGKNTTDDKNRRTRRTSTPDPEKRDAKAARAAEIDKILKTAAFDQDVAYSSALKVASGPLDRAALVTRLAQEKFGLDAELSPTEVRTILEKRFYIGQDKRAVEQAMKEAPTSFFVAAPAPFDGRAKLYRPVMGCIDRVNTLLQAHHSPGTNVTSSEAASA